MAEDSTENGRVTYKLRDRQVNMVQSWTKEFPSVITDSSEPRVEVSQGDIFKDAPAADALVSPANSFGFMDGGIDLTYSRHFGWQMQKRLQELIRSEYDGELLVGQAAIIPAYEKESDYSAEDKATCNQGLPVRWLISAPTMRVPLTVASTANAYLAFRAVILAVKKHNADPNKSRITSVLCPGLGTAVGRMPTDRCAFQMKEAFRVYELNEPEAQCMKAPADLGTVWTHHFTMAEDSSTPAVEKGCYLT